MIYKRFFAIIFIIPVFLLAGTDLSRAQNVDLGEISTQQILGKLPKTVTVQIDEKKIDLPSDQILSWLKETADLAISEEYRSEIENIDFCGYKRSMICRILFPVGDSANVKKESRTSIDRGAVEKYIADLARNNNRDPQNAQLTMEEGQATVFTLSQKGMSISEQESVQAIIDYIEKAEFQKPAILVVKTTEPEISADSINNMGITSLIGEGRSNFRGSPKNRIFNIKVATERFDGLLIKPGEEFSFVKNLGEVDGEHGYLPELVIKHDKTEPEFGGGICQVSTTAFRAAIYSGLKITARKNHAYPVSYYNPQGMDSTVYIPRPDLKFVNDTPGYILIQTKIEGTELIFQFYGTSDGRMTEIDGPKILEKNPDGSMKTTFTQKVLDKDGNVSREDVFNSKYDSPSKFPHPEPVLTEKPADWSEKKWKKYKKEHNLPI